jgi:glycosyltransferase involved in cell wall biosynthesis
MCYNQEKFIAKAMDSIMAQKTNFKVEVVIGDDFSTDNILNIIKRYKDTDHIKINILNRTKGDKYCGMR